MEITNLLLYPYNCQNYEHQDSSRLIKTHQDIQILNMKSITQQVRELLPGQSSGTPARPKAQEADGRGAGKRLEQLKRLREKRLKMGNLLTEIT